MSENPQKDFDNLAANLDKVCNFEAAHRIMEDYALHTPHIRPDDGQRFAAVFADLAPRSNDIDFNSLDIMLGRRGFYLPFEPEIFDKNDRSSQRVDISLLKDVIRNLGNRGYSDSVSDDFVENFQSYILKKVSLFDLKNDDILRLSSYFQDTSPRNRKIAKLFAQMPEKISAIHNDKIGREINELNAWAFKYKNDDLLKKLSFRSTCINLMYRRLVQEQSIRYINPQDFYQQHRLEMNRRVRELTGTLDKDGKTICRKYAINKVYKAEAADDNFKIDSLFTAIEKYADQPFYNDCCSVLNAIHGGDKSREVYMPFIERWCNR